MEFSFDIISELKGYGFSHQKNNAGGLEESKKNLLGRTY